MRELSVLKSWQDKKKTLSSNKCDHEVSINTLIPR